MVPLNIEDSGGACNLPGRSSVSQAILTMVSQVDLMEGKAVANGWHSYQAPFPTQLHLLPRHCLSPAVCRFVCKLSKQRQHPHALVTSGTARLCAKCYHAGPHCLTLSCQTFCANVCPYMLACSTASHAWLGTSSIFHPRPLANFGLCLITEVRGRSNWGSLKMTLPLLHLIELLTAFTQSAQVV